MNIVIDIKGQAEADFWLALAKEKGANAICVEDAEDTWLSGLISKGMQEQTADITLASENSLAATWLSPEEELAWKDL